MTPENFAYWLQGFSEICGQAPTKEQWEIIKDHLNLVFNKVTPNRTINSVPSGVNTLQLKNPSGGGVIKYCGLSSRTGATDPYVLFDPAIYFSGINSSKISEKVELDAHYLKESDGTIEPFIDITC